MAAIANTLRDLHRIHKNLTELRSRLERGPKQVKAAVVRIDRLTAARDEKKEQNKRLRMNADDKELQLKEREQRILDIRNKLNSASTNKEYQAFIEQISADEQANSVLSDEILELFDKVETDLEGVKAAENEVKHAEEELSKIEARVATEKETLTEDVQRLEGQLEEAEGGVPDEIRVDYDRIVRARGEDALAPLDGETCGGCYTTLRPQVLNELALGQIVFCGCGRLLYAPEETAP